MSGIKDALTSAAEALHISGDHGASGSGSQPSGKGLTLYVDEAGGSDEAGDGSKEKPYKSPLAALLAQGPEATLLVKKTPDAKALLPGEQPVAATESDGYGPISGAGLKRAKKFYDTEIKKQKKAQEKAQQESEKMGNDQQKLEDAKKVQLDDINKADYQKIKIRKGIDSRDKKVRVSAWIHRLRSQKGLIFIILRDGTGYMQAVLQDKLVSV